MNKLRLGFSVGIVCVGAMLLSACAEQGGMGMTRLPLAGYTLVAEQPQDGLARVASGASGDKQVFGYLDAAGSAAISPQYALADEFSDGLAIVSQKRGDEAAYAYIDTSGAVAVSQIDGCTISFASPFRDGFATVSLQSRAGQYVIDKAGKVYLAPGDKQYFYHNLGEGLFERHLSLNLQDPQGVVDTAGNVVYSGAHMLVLSGAPDTGFYTDDWSSYGLLDKKTFTPKTGLIYSDVTPFCAGLSLARQMDDTLLLIDTAGETVANLSQTLGEIDFERAYTLSDSGITLYLSGQEGAIIADLQGNLVAETAYDEIHTFSGAVAVCTKNGAYGYVNAAGQELLAPRYDFETEIRDGAGFVQEGQKIHRVSFAKPT